ncbi:MAG: peptidase inhibitor I78 [Phenylobacterium sp.]|nr:peptidase inhibitor I78 [Phenylobacterium sp.]
MKIKILAGAAALLLMSACASDAPAPSPPPPSYRPPPPPPPPADQCGAAEAQKYVGRPRSEIPIPVLPALQRVACTTCPVTMDYNARRLNFFYDAQTGIVKEVKCG